jgi:hypothetical protein
MSHVSLNAGELIEWTETIASIVAFDNVAASRQVCLSEVPNSASLPTNSYGNPEGRVNTNVRVLECEVELPIYFTPSFIRQRLSP